MSKSCTVFVLRGQPFHNSHKKIIQNALCDSDEVIVIVGSYRSPITIRNPWRYEYRQDLIRGSMTDAENARIKIAPLRDYLYGMNTWVTSLQNTVSSLTDPEDTIFLTGHFKDDSSFYLNYFPQWKLVTQPRFNGSGGLAIDATIIRNLMYEENPKWKDYVPEYVAMALTLYMNTDEFQRMKKEYQFIVNYKKAWEKAPYPPTFVTTDAVVIQSGHVLLIKRKREPGKGYYAIPGGFLNPNETIQKGVIRELKEETRIDVPAIVLEKSIKATHVFDHPHRSLRGRIITHASFIELDFNKPLPRVKGDDDASDAMWMPFSEIWSHEEEMFDDHLHIVNFFLNNKQYIN